MVTYSLRLAKPQVRFLAPHPLFVLLAILLLSGSSMAVDPQVVSGDFDHYAGAPDSLVVASASSDSLVRVVGGDIFGHYWSSFGGNGQITSIDGVSMTGRADGVQELATATYSTFKGVETAIAELSASDPVVLDWLEKIYDQLYTSSRSGDVVTKTSIADLLSGMDESFPGIPVESFYPSNWTTTVRTTRVSVPLLLSDLTRWFNFAFTYGEYSHLGPLGINENGTKYPYLTGILSNGLNGLAYLMFGNESHLIYGLSYTGSDKEGTRGSWSLADISANGFRGLGTLIGGQDSGDGRKAVWYWVDPSNPLAPVRNYEATSLFDLFWQIGLLQNSLAKLEYVYASQEDMEFKEQEKPNMDAVKDNFFGDGEGAVNPGQIKDVSGMSSGIKDSFAGAGSPGDAFTAINDSQSFWFFSQEVADALDTVNAPALASEEEDDFMDQFVQDEDGFYSLIDLSPWDVGSYLGG